MTVRDMCIMEDSTLVFPHRKGENKIKQESESIWNVIISALVAAGGSYLYYKLKIDMNEWDLNMVCWPHCRSGLTLSYFSWVQHPVIQQN